MKKIILILISNVIFAQSIPEPKISKFAPPEIINESEAIHDELKNALIPFVKTSKYGIGLITYRPTGDKLSTGASFKIFNPSKKTIKYVWFTVGGENPVGDLVKVGASYYKTLKAIGPVEPQGIADWSFEYIWLTNIVETLKLTTIKIQYMDNTFRTVKYNDEMYIGNSAFENVITILNKKESVEGKKSQRFVTSDDDTVYTDPDQRAEFPGGLSQFRIKVSDGINMIELLDITTGTYKSDIFFIIEKDGTLSDIKASGKSDKLNEEIVRFIKTIRNKWIPAKINDTSVRSEYRLPMTLNIE